MELSEQQKTDLRRCPIPVTSGTDDRTWNSGWNWCMKSRILSSEPRQGPVGVFMGTYNICRWSFLGRKQPTFAGRQLFHARFNRRMELIGEIHRPSGIVTFGPKPRYLKWASLEWYCLIYDFNRIIMFPSQVNVCADRCSNCRSWNDCNFWSQAI